MPVTLYDPKTGAPVELSPEEAQKAYLEGRAGPEKGSRVHVKLADNRYGTVPSSNLASVLQKGATLVAPEEADLERRKAEQSGVVGGIKAGAEGFLNGLTLGTGTGFVRKVLSPEAGDEYEKNVRARREEHPYIEGGTELLGTALPIVATEGTAAGAQLARLGAAGEAVGTRLGLGAIGQKAVGMGLRAGVENAVIGAGHEVGEEMLGNHELAAEKIAMAGGKDFLIGGVFGGGLGVGAGAIKAYRARAARDLLHGLADEAETKAAQVAEDAALKAHAEQKAARTINLGPSAHLNPEAYQDPYRVALNATDDYNVRPSSEPIKIQKERQPFTVNPDAGLSTAEEDLHTGPVDLTEAPVRDSSPQAMRRAALESAMTGEAPPPELRPGLEAELGSSFSEEGPLASEHNVFGIKKGHGATLRGGIEDLSPSKTEKAIRIETDKSAIEANEALRRGSITEPEAEIEDISKADELRDAAKETGRNADSKAAQMFWANSKASKAETMRVAGKRGGLDSVWDTAKRYEVVDMGGESGAIKSAINSISANSPQRILDRTEAALSRATEEQASVIGGTPAHVTVGEMLKPIDQEIRALQKTGITENAANALLTMKQGMLLRLGLIDEAGNLVPGALEKQVSFQDLIDRRRQLQQLVYAHGTPDANLMGAAKQKIAFAWRNQEDAALESLSKGAGDDFKKLNKDISNLIEIRDAYEARVAQLNQNNQAALGDKFAAGVGFVAGHGGPHGIVTAALAGAANKRLREVGNVTAAVALDKLSGLGTVKAMVSTADQALERAAAGLTNVAEKTPASRIVAAGGTKAVEAKKTPKEPVAARYRAAMKELDALREKDLLAHTQKTTQDLAMHAPKVANAYTFAVVRAADFLQAKRPGGLTTPSPFYRVEPSVPDTEKSKFLRYYDAVKNPMKVLEDFERGKVTTEAMEAFKATLPQAFAELQQRVMDKIAEGDKGKPLAFKKLMQLGLLFDAPTHPSLERATFRVLQANVSQPNDPVQPPAKGGKSNAPRRPVDIRNPANVFDQLATGGPGHR